MKLNDWSVYYALHCLITWDPPIVFGSYLRSTKQRQDLSRCRNKEELPRWVYRCHSCQHPDNTALWVKREWLEIIGCALNTGCYITWQIKTHFPGCGVHDYMHPSSRRSQISHNRLLKSLEYVFKLQQVLPRWLLNGRSSCQNNLKALDYIIRIPVFFIYPHLSVGGREQPGLHELTKSRSHSKLREAKIKPMWAMRQCEYPETVRRVLPPGIGLVSDSGVSCCNLGQRI